MLLDHLEARFTDMQVENKDGCILSSFGYKWNDLNLNHNSCQLADESVLQPYRKKLVAREHFQCYGSCVIKALNSYQTRAIQDLLTRIANLSRSCRPTPEMQMWSSGHVVTYNHGASPEAIHDADDWPNGRGWQLVLKTGKSKDHLRSVLTPKVIEIFYLRARSESHHSDLNFFVL